MPEQRPAPPVELLEWPTADPSLPVELFRLPAEREAELAKRLPAPGPNAWETAQILLGRVSQLWKHDNNHVERHDAVDILDRVAAGERFACDEYATVLSQALNARRIPARWVGLFRTEYHAGVGAAHTVSEAWIDDLRRWVVLDGQNGAYWSDDDGRPLGVVELQREFHRTSNGGAGNRRARLTGVAGSLPDDEEDFWWQYFSHASTSGLGPSLMWASGSFCPIFQERFVLDSDRLLRSAAHAYPDLAAVWLGVAGTAQQPAVSLKTSHPFPNGFIVSTSRGKVALPVDNGVWPLDMDPGEHRATIHLVTDHAEIPAGNLVYRVAG